VRHGNFTVALCLPLIATCALAAAPERGLVGHWAFDETKGRVVPDQSGQANDAMVRAGTLVKGVSNTGMGFDGRTTVVYAAPSPSLSPTKALTIEAWVKLAERQLAGFPAIVRKENAFALRFDGPRLGLVLWHGETLVYLHSKRTEWPTGEWLHVAATYDGAHMRLFVNGVEDASSPHDKPIEASPMSVYIGSSIGGGTLAGVLDEVRLYNRALSPVEIKASVVRGRQSLQAQKDVAIKPQQVGDTVRPFRKPPRKIAMAQDGFLWIDAEDFTDYGGWLLDTQFVHLMGSAYLIAAGVGTPVADATVEVDIPRTATWRVWVRSRDWIPEHSPGQFKVVIGGVPSAKVFGKAAHDRWHWASAGDFGLKQGKTTLALHDLTGYYGRCDALVLTTDLKYTPPEKVEDIARERSRLTGLSLEPQDGGTFDVIVVGAGSAGGPAAIAAARLGAKTALIQNRPVLGGNASIELGVHICGAGSSKPNARESGIIEEVGRVKARYGYPKMSEPFRIVAAKEKNLTVLLNRHVFAAEMADKKTIAAVKAVDTLTNAIYRYRARMFIDCTGDGWLGYFAGADFRFGREARAEFNESLAPEKADKITMSGCLMGRRALSYRAVDTGKPAPYTPPPWAAKFPPPTGFGRRIRHFAGGQWWLEHPGTINDVWDAEQARDELIRISFGYWDYIKNRWPERERARNYTIAYVPIGDAKRESRRLLGDHILTQNDVLQAVPFPDRIAHGGWPIDVHHPKGIYSGDEGSYDCNPRTPLYSIPYRCLYSRNIDNLLMAGRCMSVTHIALGTVRVQGTLATTGQAAGTAAAMAVARNTTPRGIYEKHLAALQQTLLKHDQYIPDLRNQDPADLARKAKVTASSTATYDEFDDRHGRKGGDRDIHPLNMPRAVMFPRGVHKKFETVSLLLASENAEDTPVTLHVREGKETGDFSSRDDIKTVVATVPAGKKGWVDFKLDVAPDAPFVWVWLPATEGVSWHLGRAPLGSCRAYGGDAHWTVVKGQFYAFRTRPALAVPADYAPEYAINGVSRVVGSARNQWASDPAKPMPQWLELAWEKPTTLNTVYLTFDTDMNAKYHTAPLPPECVRDYELTVHDGKAWRTVATVKGNFQRRRVHRFEPVAATRLRLTVHATNGDKSARLFEIRAYNE